MDKKRDWVKIIAIVLAILFFIFWIITGFNSETQEQTNQDISIICNQAINNTALICKQSIDNNDMLWYTNYKSLHFQWQNTFNTLLNCYKNNIPSCDYSLPQINETLIK